MPAQKLSGIVWTLPQRLLFYFFFVLRANNSMFSADGSQALESKILKHFKGLINSHVKKKKI